MNRSADRFSSQADQNSADSAAENPDAWPGRVERWPRIGKTMTPLAHCFNARKNVCSTVSATRGCNDGLATAETFLAGLVSPLRALQIP